MSDHKKCCDSCENCECMQNSCCNGTCTCCKKWEGELTKEHLLEKKEKFEKKLAWVNDELSKMENAG